MNELKEPPVYTVRGSNWEVNVPTDEYNMQFSVPEQMMEVATRAMEAFKGIRTDFILKMDEGQETPHLGPILCVWPKDDKQACDNPHFILAHICLGNCGQYKDAAEIKFVWEKENKGRATPKAILDQINNFDELRKEIEKKSEEKSQKKSPPKRKRGKKDIDNPPSSE
jgi:hypothetical protein